MREDDLSRVLLVQACEQSDPEGLYVAFGDRRAASVEASRSVRVACIDWNPLATIRPDYYYMTSDPAIQKPWRVLSTYSNPDDTSRPG